MVVAVHVKLSPVKNTFGNRRIFRSNFIGMTVSFDLTYWYVSAFSWLAGSNSSSTSAHWEGNLHSFYWKRDRTRLFIVHKRIRWAALKIVYDLHMFRLLVKCGQSRRPPTNLNWLWMRCGKLLSYVFYPFVSKLPEKFRWESLLTKLSTLWLFGNFKYQSSNTNLIISGTNNPGQTGTSTSKLRGKTFFEWIINDFPTI